MNPTVELVLKRKKANMRKSDFLMLEALKSAPHLNDRPGFKRQLKAQDVTAKSVRSDILRKVPKNIFFCIKLT